MSSQVRFALIAVFGPAALAVCGWAQDVPAVNISGGGADRPWKDLFRSAESRLATEPFDPLAEPLLKAADGFTRAIFRLPDAKPSRNATYHSPDGDCLLASWTFGEAINTLFLNDTPFQSIYSLRLRGARQVAAGNLIAFLGELVAFKAPPLNLGPAELSIDAGPASSSVSYFIGSTTTRSPYELLRDIQISGGTDGHDWYLSLTVPKAYAKSYYPEPLFIPERFPALADLLPTWSFDHVWSEVGPHGESGLAHMQAPERNTLLIAELVRRGLSEQQFVELLIPKDATSLRTRLGEVWSGFSAAHAEGLYARYGAAALHRYSQIGPKAEEAAELYFVGDCSREFDSLAKATLKEQVYWIGALRYLGRCSNSADDLRMLEALSVPDRASEPRKFALRDIKERIGSAKH